MHASDSLAALLAEYRRDRTLATSSFQQLEIAVNKFAAWHATTCNRPAVISDLTRANLHDWMDALAKPPDELANPTINRKRGAVLSLANFAADDLGLIPAMRRPKRLVEGTDPPIAWTLSEFDRLLWSAGLETAEWEDGANAGDCWSFGFRMIWDSGARFEELWSAKTAHVDFDQATWFVQHGHRKGKRQGRLYALAPDTLDAIKATLTTPPRERLWPFPWKKRQVWIHWDRILLRAGLPSGRTAKWHCIRKTAESHAAAQRGAAWAAEAVGHSEAVARRHYLAPSIVPTPSLSDCLPRPRPKPNLSLYAG
ncbi:MAG: hypothetical protein GX547_16310 [Phycisphaerae bacterium]|nr:hypothetical protein [Phycisphaerae bacterium]